MRKTPSAPGDSASSSRRSIPAVERILSGSELVQLAHEFGREPVKRALAEQLRQVRESGVAYDDAAIATGVRESLRQSFAPSLIRTINGSGVIIHTNLGRAPIDPQIWDEAAAIVTGYANLEYDLARGERGSRDDELSSLCCSLFGCEAAVLTNNNAAAVLLLLAAVAGDGRDVLVSRGELVEIGGSFRVPDVIQQGGARLREVGTTNRTRAVDYAAAADEGTAAILRVHRSNFELVGFTETPRIEHLVAVAHEKKLPFLFDEGSGRVVDLARYGFAHAETLRELLAAGVDALTCSTDKLIGATQGGLILGSAELVGRVRRHPLMRALRAGKESYAIVAATLRAFASGRHEERIPIYRMLATPIDELRARGESLISGTTVRLVDSRCALGGGTTPTETIASLAIEVPGQASELAFRFRSRRPPIVGRIVDERFTIELRTLLPEELEPVAVALKELH